MKKTAVRHEDGMAVPPLPPPTLASTPGLGAPTVLPLPPPGGAWARGPSWEQRAGRGARGVLAGATKAPEAKVGGLSSVLVGVGGTLGGGPLAVREGLSSLQRRLLGRAGDAGRVVSVSSSTYKVTEESRRRRLGQCWWIWNQA